ncbi:MAG: tRNA threonylcarbamoyl adenosine modification protein YeaZ [Myxococcota bacterium]|jgi:tRNA threonylcarbamoyl adenosine modification protein YeaZ
MANYLSLELSSNCCTVAIHTEGAYQQLDFSDQRGRGVVCAVEKILCDNHLEAKNLDAIYVGIGPGSYTGLRIACSAAVMLAYSLGIKCYGINSFEAMAWQRAKLQPLTILLDAYRKQYYHAAYSIEQQKLVCIQQPHIIEQQEWDESQPSSAPDTTAIGILRFVIEYIDKHSDIASNHLFNAEPLYLRPPAFRQQKKTRLNK